MRMFNDILNVEVKEKVLSISLKEQTPKMSGVLPISVSLTVFRNSFKNSSDINRKSYTIYKA